MHKDMWPKIWNLQSYMSEGVSRWHGLWSLLLPLRGKYCLSYSSHTLITYSVYFHIGSFFTTIQTSSGSLAKNLRSDVRIPAAIRNATRPAHHAFKTALGLVSTKVGALCPAQHLATASHARIAAPKISSAAIDVQVSVASYVQWDIASYVPTNKGRELTCWNSSPSAKWTSIACLL